MPIPPMPTPLEIAQRNLQQEANEEFLYAEEQLGIGSFVAVSSHRFIAVEFKKGKYVPWLTINLSDISAIDFDWNKSAFYDSPIIVFDLRDNQRKGFDIINFEDLETREKLPRAISQAAHVPFAPPRVLSPQIHKVNPAFFVQFYPKSDLLWPSKCPACLQPINEHNSSFHRIIPRLGGDRFKFRLDNQMNWNLRTHIELHIGYCSSCYQTLFNQKKSLFSKSPKAPVFDSSFDGIKVFIFIDKSDYANEFAQLNSTPSVN